MSRIGHKWQRSFRVGADQRLWISLTNETGPECMAYAEVDCSGCPLITTEHGDVWTTEEALLAGREENGKHSAQTSALLHIRDGGSAQHRPKQEQTIVLTIWKRRVAVRDYEAAGTLRHTIWVN